MTAKLELRDPNPSEPESIWTKSFVTFGKLAGQQARYLAGGPAIQPASLPARNLFGQQDIWPAG